MPPIGDAPPAGYAPISQTLTPPSAAPNVVDIKGRKLEDVLRSLGRATGNPDAELRTHHDAHGVSILVPSSKSSVPSGWTRFKAALSNLPLLGRATSLRAARLEVDSKPLNDGVVDGLVATIEREEKSIEKDLNVELKGQYADLARRALDKRPLTKRSVERVLDDTLKTMSSYAAEVRMRRTMAAALGAEVPVPRDPPPLPSRKEPLTKAQQLALEGTPVVPARKTEVPVAARSPSPTGRHKGLMNLCTQAVTDKLGPSADQREVDVEVRKMYDDARSFLIRRNKWPLAELDDAVAAVAYLNR